MRYTWASGGAKGHRHTEGTKTMARSKICEICNLRPATEEMNAQVVYCYPCSTMADMENHHSDYSHDTLLQTPDAKLTLKGWNFKAKADLLAWAQEERKVMETCWICNPELDLTKLPYVARKGTSREGMVIHVPLRATGREKAETVKELLAAAQGATVAAEDVRITTRKGITTLKVNDYTLTWGDAHGSSRGTGGSYVNGDGRTVKIRNVSEFLKLVGCPGE